jgi:hypothetical protein
MVRGPENWAAFRRNCGSGEKDFLSRLKRFVLFRVTGLSVRYCALLPQQHKGRSHDNGWQDGPQKQFYR